MVKKKKKKNQGRDPPSQPGWLRQLSTAMEYGLA